MDIYRTKEDLLMTAEELAEGKKKITLTNEELWAAFREQDHICLLEDARYRNRPELHMVRSR